MSQITWTTFFTILSFILIVYYITIIILYYRKAFSLSLLAKIFRQPVMVARTSTNDTSATTTLYVSITRLAEQAAADGYGREEILLALHKLLHTADDNGLSNSSNRTNVSQYIANACEQYCSIHLSEEDLRVLWI